MLNSAPFYFASIRKIAVTFGNLFNEIDIVRKNSADTEVSRHRVPIAFGGKNSWIARAKAKATTDSDTAIDYQNILPRMSFEFTSLTYDNSKQLNASRYNITDKNTTEKKKQLGPVPYKFGFTLTVYAKYMDDALQILEQILPYFAPAINVKIKEQSDPEVVNDVRIMFDGMSSSDNYLDGFETNRLITFDLAFSVSGNIYPPVNDTKYIRKVIANIDNSTFDPPTDIETIERTAAPGETSNKDNSTTTIIEGQ